MLYINHALSITAVCEIESIIKIECKHPFTEPPAAVKETRHGQQLGVCSWSCLPALLLWLPSLVPVWSWPCPSPWCDPAWLNCCGCPDPLHFNRTYGRDEGRIAQQDQWSLPQSPRGGFISPNFRFLDMRHLLQSELFKLTFRWERQELFCGQFILFIQGVILQGWWHINARNYCWEK